MGRSRGMSKLRGWAEFGLKTRPLSDATTPENAVWGSIAREIGLPEPALPIPPQMWYALPERTRQQCSESSYGDTQEV